MSASTRILDWLRAGYPDGIPPNDYPPVLGVLRRNLTDTDIESIADELAMQSVSSGNVPVTADDIRAMVHSQAFQSSTPEDITRVSAKLAAGGWPLAAEIEP
jgi:hypothetical protein